MPIDLRELFSDAVLQEAIDLLVEQVRDESLLPRDRRQAAAFLLTQKAKLARLRPKPIAPVKTQGAS